MRRAGSGRLSLIHICKETTAAQEPDTTAPVAAGETADPLGKYEEEITVTMVRDIDPSMKFDTSREGYKSLEDNVWTKAYKEQLGINIEYLWTAPVDEYLSKWNVAIAGGDIPDMAIVPGQMCIRDRRLCICPHLSNIR